MVYELNLGNDTVSATPCTALSRHFLQQKEIKGGQKGKFILCGRPFMQQISWTYRVAINPERENKDEKKKKVKLLHVLLTPKKAGTLEVNNYWSISLVGSIYKILIKSIGKYIEGDIGRDCVNHRIHLFKADKYLTLFLQLMKVWIAI